MASIGREVPAGRLNSEWAYLFRGWNEDARQSCFILVRSPEGSKNVRYDSAIIIYFQDLLGHADLVVDTGTGEHNLVIDIPPVIPRLTITGCQEAGARKLLAAIEQQNRRHD
jgi:hypothetical protein